MAGERKKYAKYSRFTDDIKAHANAMFHPQDSSYEKQVMEQQDNAALLRAHEEGESLTNDEQERVRRLRAGN